MTKLKLKVIEVIAIVMGAMCVFMYNIAAYNRPPSGDSGTISDINQTLKIDDILDYQRQQIIDEMKSFEYRKDNEHLADLIPESNGQPFRSIVVTTWRTGSTFLGEILNTMPGNFYHFEPLLDFGVRKIRGPPHDKQAIYNLKQLLNCNYNNLTDYLNFGIDHEFLFSYNIRLWRYCRLHPEYCANPNFLSSFCRLFPLQSMKIIRLSLALAEQLLEDRTLNVRIVYLVRDPRATMQSRKRCEWCPGNPDCDHIPNVCEDLVSDYYAATNLSMKYPRRFTVLRYEELSLDPFSVTENILDFYGLPFDRKVRAFLASHTVSDIGSIYSTYRDSKSTPFRWMDEVSFQEIDSIQTSCKKAMQFWGYKRMEMESHGDREFNPLFPSPFS